MTLVDKFWMWLTGTPWGGVEKGEDRILKGMETSLFKSLSGALAKECIRQMVWAADKEGMEKPELQYLFWTLAEQVESWPSLYARPRRGLLLVKELLTISKKMPNYRQGFAVPREGRDVLIDNALERVAEWAGSKQVAALLEAAYMKAIREAGPQLAALRGHPDLPLEGSMKYAKMLFEQEIWGKPIFKHPITLRRIVKLTKKQV